MPEPVLIALQCEVTMRFRIVTFFVLILGATLLTAACGSTTTAPTTLSSITITGTSPVVGSASQLIATGVLNDGVTEDVTSTASWMSSDPSIATVSSSGSVTGVAAGTAAVYATVGNVTGTLQLVVN